MGINPHEESFAVAIYRFAVDNITHYRCPMVSNHNALQTNHVLILYIFIDRKTDVSDFVHITSALIRRTQSIGFVVRRSNLNARYIVYILSWVSKYNPRT